MRDRLAAPPLPSGILYRVLPDIIVSVHNGTMTDAQWSAMVDAGYEQGRATRTFCTLVVIIGGPPPTSRQRMVLSEAIKGRNWTAAAVTDCPLIRLATTAMSWSQPGLKTYALAQLDQAMDHVAARSSRRAEIGSAIDALRAELGVATPRAPFRAAHGASLIP